MRNEVNRAHKAKTTLRYLLSLIAILSVVSVSAATFGTTYQTQRRGIQYAQLNTPMPTLAMSSTGSVMMQSGSTLPMAAVSGTTTTEQTAPNRHRAKKEDPDPSNPFGGQTIGGVDNPNEPGTPIGDAAVPMMLMALAWVMVRMIRRKAAQ